MNLLIANSLQQNFLVTKQFASKLQVQNLSHKVFFPLSFWKVYKESFASHFHIQNMGHVRWTN
jgi:hypothetical protein